MLSEHNQWKQQKVTAIRVINYNVTSFTVLNYSHCQRSNQVSICITQPCIVFSEVPSSSIKWEIRPKRNNITPDHAWEVNNGICSQPKASAYPSILMLVLEFHLLAQEIKSDHRVAKNSLINTVACPLMQ